MSSHGDTARMSAAQLARTTGKASHCNQGDSTEHLTLLDKCTDEYSNALEHFFKSQGESQLLRANEIGRAALGDRLSVLDMAHVYLESLERVLQKVENQEHISQRREGPFLSLWKVCCHSR